MRGDNAGTGQRQRMERGWSAQRCRFWYVLHYMLGVPNTLEGHCAGSIPWMTVNNVYGDEEPVIDAANSQRCVACIFEFS
jgi:hypothetical protein